MITLTWIGWIAIPLAIFLFFRASEWLYRLTIFFIPFSATAIFNISHNGNYSGLQITIFFGSFWIIHELLQNKALKYKYLNNIDIILLALFGLTALFSLIMPLIINGHLYIIPHNIAAHNEVLPLYFSQHNVTQFLYLLYGIVLTLMIIRKNSNTDQLMQSIKIYVFAGLFVSLWGWLQFILYQYNIPYPYIIFNNNLGEAAQGFTGILNGHKRISSVATEPSYFAQFLLTIIPILLIFILNKQSLMSPLIDKCVFIIITSILFLSTSTSANIGMIIILILTLIILFNFKKLNFSNIIILIVLISLAFVPNFIYNTAAQNTAQIADKVDSFSGKTRLLSIIYAWQYFIQYPILGIGWGSIVSHDMIINLLATTGIIGCSIMMGLLIHIMYQLILVANNIKYQQNNILQGLTISLITLVLINILTGFAYVFSHFWFILGLAIAVISNYILNKQPFNINSTKEKIN